MNFHPEDFIALSLQVEKEGGRLLEEPCTGKRLKYRIPSSKGGHKWVRAWTTHCDMSARMEVPYNPALRVLLHDDEEDDVVIVDNTGEKARLDARVTVCAVDDAVGLWPRYAGVISDRSYQP